jgi:wobble nucleotide-excising tRNase
METIKAIRTLKGAAILADKSAKEARSDFHRYNLVYGFNGSGKSTLSRILGCLQSGKQQAGLPLLTPSS